MTPLAAAGHSALGFENGNTAALPAEGSTLDDGVQGTRACEETTERVMSPSPPPQAIDPIACPARAATAPSQGAAADSTCAPGWTVAREEEDEYKGGVVPRVQDKGIGGNTSDVKDDEMKAIDVEEDKEEEGEEELHDGCGYDVYNPNADEFVDEKMAEATMVADVEPGAGVKNAAGADASGEDCVKWLNTPVLEYLIEFCVALLI